MDETRNRPALPGPIPERNAHIETELRDAILADAARHIAQLGALLQPASTGPPALPALRVLRLLESYVRNTRFLLQDLAIPDEGRDEDDDNDLAAPDAYWPRRPRGLGRRARRLRRHLAANPASPSP